MKFNVEERMVMGNLMPILAPEKSNRHFYALLDELAKKFSLTEKEIRHIEVKFGGETFKDPDTGKEEVVQKGKMIWRSDRNADKNIDIPEVINNVIVSSFQEMDRSDALPREAIPIFDRFVEELKWYKQKE